jgi:hypothetical protein
MVHLQYIQDRAKRKLAGWQGKLVNVAGRRELVRSVLSSLRVYLLTALKPPKKFLKELDKLRKMFLWSGDGEISGGKCKVAWTSVCAPKPNGGLGIKNLEYFSQSLRLRWLWFSWDDVNRPWAGLELHVTDEDRSVFDAATIVKLGNGKKTSFWNSRWLNGDTLAARFSVLHKHSRRKNRTVAEAVANNGWIVDIDYNLSLQLIMEYVQLSEILDNVTLTESEPDSITWVPSPDGTYSAKSAYDLHFIGQTRCLSADQTWDAKAPPKCKLFIWLMLQNRIWTAARLLSGNGQTSTSVSFA